MAFVFADYEDRYSGRDARSPKSRGCNRSTCPRRSQSNQFSTGGRNEEATNCICNCPVCRKGFETKEKLAMLIAQALEIFITGYEAKQTAVKEGKNKKDKKDKKKNKKKKGKGMNVKTAKGLPRSRSGVRRNLIHLLQQVPCRAYHTTRANSLTLLLLPRIQIIVAGKTVIR